MAERVALTPGKARGLSATSTAAGHFAVLAIDHRDSLRVVLDPDEPDRISASDLTAVKLDLLAVLGPQCSAVMLEPEYSAAQAIIARALPGDTGFLAAVEAQGYLGDPTARQASLLEGWGIEKAKRLGANGIKLLVLYRPDGGAVTDQQDVLIADVVADCARFDIPLFLEPLAYASAAEGSTDSNEFAAHRRALVIETVRRLGALGPDVLKVQFPVDPRRETDRSVWRDACAELDETAPVPWALLSGGGSFDDFRDQLEVACDAGASGFMVGRALWGEYVTALPGARAGLATSLLVPRFAELSAIAASHGRDWGQRHDVVDVDERWYLTY